MDKTVFNSLSSSLQNIKVVKHLSRQKMLVMTICAMLKSRSVVLPELAQHLNDGVKTDSNETRLRDFFRETTLDYEAVAIFIVAFLKQQPNLKIRLTIDRTNWEFGNHSTNILMIIASKGTFSIPLYWEMLDNKGGNSNTAQRTDLLQKCIDLLGTSNIGLLLGDREFVGSKWLKYLKINKIPFCVRVPKSHLIENESGEILQAQSIWQKQKNQNDKSYYNHCMVDSVWGNVMIGTDAKGKLLYLMGTAKSTLLDQLYKKRWTIETMFQSFKSRGFNLEMTHITINERLKKLIAIVAMAFTFAIALGQFRHDNQKKIRNKAHGRKAKSFFRYGLDFIRDGFKIGYKYRIEWLCQFREFIQYIFLNNTISLN
jgi:hypothetical protein